MAAEKEKGAIYDFPLRKWGIELEIKETVTREQIKRVVKSALQLNGFRDRNVRCAQYCHDDANNKDWKAKTDSSCGNELTSPVLFGWKGLRELQVATDAIDSYATSRHVRLVDRRCGVHVHVDCRDFTWLEIRNLAIAMKVWEPLFFAMNPQSRKENGFCRPICFPVLAMKEARSNDAVRDAWGSWENGEDRESRRHHGFNLETWFDRGSVEFRYFSGTWAFEKGAAAVMMCVLFVDAVKNKGEVRIPNEQLVRSFADQWAIAGRMGFDKYADKFFRDFLVLRMNACPAFKEFRKFVLTRIANFYQSDGTTRRASGASRTVLGQRRHSPGI